VARDSGIRVVRGTIRARGPNQREYLRRMHANDLNFGVGPAGTGKTYLAVACAVEALSRGAGASASCWCGRRWRRASGSASCPATWQKVDPYLRPLYDALYEMMGFDRWPSSWSATSSRWRRSPSCAAARSTTRSSSWTRRRTRPIEQMKMFLTRIGFGSKAVVTGDVTQIDLPAGRPSGLRHVLDVLRGVEGVGFQFFESRDVVRHPLVQRIVQAYEARSGDTHSLDNHPGDSPRNGSVASPEPQRRRPDVAVDVQRAVRDWAPSTARIGSWVRAAVGPRGAGREVAVRVVGAAESRRLNRGWRRQDHPTNVLSFPAPSAARPRRRAGAAGAPPAASATS
jgi:hypothetical protein